MGGKGIQGGQKGILRKGGQKGDHGVRGIQGGQKGFTGDPGLKGVERGSKHRKGWKNDPWVRRGGKGIQGVRRGILGIWNQEGWKKGFRGSEGDLKQSIQRGRGEWSRMCKKNNSRKIRFSYAFTQ